MNVEFIDPPEVRENKKSRGISQVVRIENPGAFIYLSGQLPYDVDDNLIGAGDAEAQARQVFENIRYNLAAAGAGFDDVVKMTGFITDFDHVPAIRKVRAQYVNPDQPPVSTMVLVPRFLEETVYLEIDVVAVVA